MMKLMWAAWFSLNVRDIEFNTVLNSAGKL